MAVEVGIIAAIASAVVAIAILTNSKRNLL
jgi:hypothetical protein